jgi:hypothetical protein
MSGLCSTASYEREVEVAGGEAAMASEHDVQSTSRGTVAIDA